MQFEFLTALLVVSACFVQVSVAHPQNTQVQQNNLIIIQEKEIFQIFQQTVQKAMEVFYNLIEQVEAATQEGIATAKKQLDELIAKAQKQIEEIKQKAEKVGADISECLANNEDAFKALFEKFLRDEFNCVQKEGDEALRIINEGIQIGTNFNKALQDLFEKLKACGIGLRSIGCQMDVFVKVASLNKDLPPQIAEKMQEVTSFVSGINVRLETCAVTQVGNAGLAAAEIVADVVKCAADKIGEDF